MKILSRYTIFPPVPDNVRFECHAATIAQTSTGLIAAWFAGRKERDPSVGIWSSRLPTGASCWTAPERVYQDDRLPCWNPVLHQIPLGPLLLFFRIGESPRSWWSVVTRSLDHGDSWEEPTGLPDGYLGPIRNKPYRFPSGMLLCGSSDESSSFFEILWEDLRYWRRNRCSLPGVIQPTLFRMRNGRFSACLRPTGRIRQVYQSHMLDSDPAEWTLWSPPVPIDLPNPKSALDGLTLQDGRHLLIYNHCHRGRTPLSVAIAEDDNFHWKPLGNLETAPGEYSYPAIIQTPAGEIHLVYSQRRRTIAHLQLGL